MEGIGSCSRGSTIEDTKKHRRSLDRYGISYLGSRKDDSLRPSSIVLVERTSQIVCFGSIPIRKRDKYNNTITVHNHTLDLASVVVLTAKSSFVRTSCLGKQKVSIRYDEVSVPEL